MTLKTHRFHPSILREYDIRGLVDDTLHAKDCYFTGRAFGTFLKSQQARIVTVGYDGRQSSKTFADALIEGLLECGLDVENIGLGPTPMTHFGMKSRSTDAAVMITGSHSPLAFNGIKMALSSGPFYGEAVQDLGRCVAAGRFADGQGRLFEVDVQDAYVDRLVQDYEGPRDLTVAWDNGNGAAGEILRRLVKKLPGRHILLFDEIDARFPHHHPDPSVAANMRDLQAAVRQHDCDLGIGFDGDADRIGAVDNQGQFLTADILMTLYAKDILEKHPGAPIIADVKCSRVLFDEIQRLGGQPVMWKTGHSLLKAKMRELQAPLAGELSGHICFGDKHYGVDDAPYAAIRLLNLVSRSGPLSALTARLPHMQATPEWRIPIDPDRKFKVAGEIAARLRQSQRKDLQINDIDGVRVTTSQGWWLVRASNTEDLLTLRAEGFSTPDLTTLKHHMFDQLLQSGVRGLPLAP